MAPWLNQGIKLFCEWRALGPATVFLGFEQACTVLSLAWTTSAEHKPRSYCDLADSAGYRRIVAASIRLQWAAKHVRM